jgi:hypothetical protein
VNKLDRRNCAAEKNVYLQFLFWVHIKVQKGVFFNTKYLPKHQGVSCCDLLHLQYLSDASFSLLYCASLLGSNANAMQAGEKKWEKVK